MTPKPVAPVNIHVTLPGAPLPAPVNQAIQAAVSESWQDGYRRGAAGEAGIELVNKPGVRALAVVCSHGYLAGEFEEWKRTVNLFGSVHPQCPVRWVHKLWWPAAAGGVAARRVTGTPDDAAQAALARVRSQGQEVERFLALNQCFDCVAGLSEVCRHGSGAVVLSLIHERRCPEWKGGA